jgi:hypothetical protein
MLRLALSPALRFHGRENTDTSSICASGEAKIPMTVGAGIVW